MSPIWTRIFSIGTPSSSAAIMHKEARKPPISGVPAVRERVPSSLSESDTEVSPPMLNQKPLATPRPWFLPSGVRQWACDFAASSVSIMPIGPNFGP